MHYQKVKEHQPTEILEENFYVVQAKLFGWIEGEYHFSREQRILLQLVDELVAAGQLSPEFAQEVRDRIAMDLEKLSRIMVQSGQLISSAKTLDADGDVRKQNQILKDFLVDVLQTCSDRQTRYLAIQATQQLKLEAGISTDELQALVDRGKSPKAIEAEAEALPPETETIASDSEQNNSTQD